MLNTSGGDTANTANKHTELTEFRLLIALVFVWFFIAAAVRRLLPGKASVATVGGKRESCFEQAKRSAYSVIPYAFMRY
jgi:hypothetical protein